jgi:hypothetical protein
MRKTTLSYLLFLLFAGAYASLTAATISILPASSSVAVGQTFSLTVQVTGAADLYGYQFDIGFDPTKLLATSVTEGPFLLGAGPTLFTPGLINNVGGSINGNSDLLNGAIPGANGNGTLLTVSFKALSTGTSNLSLLNLLALNSFGQGLTYTTSTAAVNVTGVPEPAAFALLATTGLGLLLIRLRRHDRRISAINAPPSSKTGAAL